MPANSEQHLNAVVHAVTEHVEHINATVDDDPSKTWHELERLRKFLDRELANAD